MFGKIAANLMFILAFTYFMLFSMTFFIHIGINERVNDISYDICEIISTKGVLSSKLLEHYQESLMPYGEFDIDLKLEKEREDGLYDVFYSRSEILDINLKQGDRVSLHAYTNNSSLIEKLSGARLRPAAMKTAIISNGGWHVQQVNASIIAIILAGFMLLSIAGAQLESFDKRYMKQNLNAAGREIYSCVLVDNNEKITINEEMTITKVKKSLGARGDGFIGAIFVYDDYVVGLDGEGRRTAPVFYQTDYENLILKVNSVLKQISQGANDKLMTPTIEAADSSDEQLQGVLFNKVAATTVFLVYQGKTYYTVSGFTLSL